MSYSCKAACDRKRILRNWVLYVCIILALLGLLLSLLLFLRPCEEVLAVDTVIAIDGSGSVDSQQFAQEMNATKLFVNRLGAKFTDKYDSPTGFRVSLLQFSTGYENITTNGAFVPFTDIAPALATPTQIRENTNFKNPTKWAEYLFSLPYVSAVDTDADVVPFKLFVLVTDGREFPQTPNATLTNNLKAIGAKVLGIYVGTDTTGQRELYTHTSCTSSVNTKFVENVPTNSSCIYFVKADSFDILTATVEALADTLAADVPAVCLGHPAVWTFLLLAIPLAVYLLYKPVERIVAPPKPAPVPAPAPAPAPAPVAGSHDRKWAPVNAGGYLWAMGGRAARIVTVDYGKSGHVPSAPQGHRDMNTAQVAQAANASASPAAVVADVYSGGEVQLRVSRWICCCIWRCLSEEERRELENPRSELSESGEPEDTQI